MVWGYNKNELQSVFWNLYLICRAEFFVIYDGYLILKTWYIWFTMTHCLYFIMYKLV